MGEAGKGSGCYPGPETPARPRAEGLGTPGSLRAGWPLSPRPDFGQDRARKKQTRRRALGTRKAASCRSRLRGPVRVKVAPGPAPGPAPQHHQQQRSQSRPGTRSSMPAPEPADPPRTFPFGFSAPPPPGVWGRGGESGRAGSRGVRSCRLSLPKSLLPWAWEST